MVIYKRQTLIYSKLAIVLFQPLVNNATVELSLIYSKSEITIATDKLFYDGYDTIGDIGGYMGLLLGASLLSIYDIGHTLYRRFFEKRRQQQGREEDCDGRVSRKVSSSKTIVVAPSPKSSLNSLPAMEKVIRG